MRVSRESRGQSNKSLLCTLSLSVSEMRHASVPGTTTPIIILALFRTFLSQARSTFAHFLSFVEFHRNNEYNKHSN
jgi:hypothetical protein